MSESKFLTKEGFDKLNAELRRYFSKRAEIAKRIEEAKGLGDVSENADYLKVKEEQAFNEGRIREIERILLAAEVIETKKNNHQVEMNSLVTVKDKKGRSYQYKIVGSGESDSMKGKISYESPLGQQFLGKKVNDILEIETPAGKKVYKIIAID